MLCRFQQGTIQKVRSPGGGGEGVSEKANKNERYFQGGGSLPKNKRSFSFLYNLNSGRKAR